MSASDKGRSKLIISACQRQQKYSPSTFLLFSLVLLLTSLLSACVDGAEQTSIPVKSAAATDWYTIYFTDPQRPDAGSFRGGPDAALAEAIGKAQLSVDAALYDLNLWSIRDALVAAHRRGVMVRVVAESDNLDEPEMGDLEDAGIPVLGDRREGLMHNKYIVIDRQEVWTGSMNFTTTDAYFNDNNLVKIRSTQLAANYIKEFEEMFADDHFGPDTRPDTPNPRLTVNSIMVENYFAPDDRPAQRITELITEAQESIYFLAFSFTADPLAEAIIQSAQRGVAIAGVMEKSQVASNTGGDYQLFVASGLDVRLDGNRRNMHNKVIIIDKRIVITGSYNFSNSAETRNDENILIFHDAQIAEQYLAEFERIYAETQK